MYLTDLPEISHWCCGLSPLNIEIVVQQASIRITDYCLPLPSSTGARSVLQKAYGKEPKTFHAPAVMLLISHFDLPFIFLDLASAKIHMKIGNMTCMGKA
jgi:hypothetical protein